jgi:hypothetical protein
LWGIVSGFKGNPYNTETGGWGSRTYGWFFGNGQIRTLKLDQGRQEGNEVGFSQDGKLYFFMPVGEEKLRVCRGFGHLEEYKVHLRGCEVAGLDGVGRTYVHQMTGKQPRNRGGDFIDLDEYGRLCFIGHHRLNSHSGRTDYVRDFYPQEYGGGVRRIGYFSSGHPVGHGRIYSKEGKLETITNQLKPPKGYYCKAPRRTICQGNQEQRD